MNLNQSPKMILLSGLVLSLMGLTALYAGDNPNEVAERDAVAMGQQLRDSTLKGADVCIVKAECVLLGAAVEMKHEGFETPFPDIRYGIHIATVDAKNTGLLKTLAGRDPREWVNKIRALPNLVDLRVKFKPDYRQPQTKEMQGSRMWSVEHEVMLPDLTKKQAKALYEANLRLIENGKRICELAKTEIEMVPSCEEMAKTMSDDQK